MRVFINGRFLTQRATGVHRFAFEMCKALHRIGFEFTVVAPPKVLESYDVTFPIVTYGHTSSHFWEQVELPCFLRKNGNPFLISFSGLGPIFYKRHIATIHDIAFLVNPAWYKKKYYVFYKFMTAPLARNAYGIITVSNFSKHELIEQYHLPDDKIRVIYNAVSSDFTANNKTSGGKDNTPYILAVSSMDPRKNFPRLISAFVKMNDNSRKLYIIGGVSPSFNNIEMPDYSKEHIKFLGYVSNEKLVEYYRNADLFVYPSLYEGFGIPPIEALSQNCPVLVSDIDVFHEVCDNAAFYCNPYSVDSICESMKYILSHPSEVSDKIKKAGDILERYGWDKSAKNLVEWFNLKTNQL